MIKVSQYFFDLKISNYSLPFGAFKELIVSEEVGGILPQLQMSVVSTNPLEMYPILSKTNTKISVGIGSSDKNIEYLDFALSDFQTTRSGGEYHFTIFGVLDVKEYTNVPRIRSFSGKSSDQVLSSISSLKPTIKYKGSDKQIWIQPNSTDKEFVKQVANHAYVSDQTYITYAVTSNKELVVKDGKQIFSEQPKLKFSNTGDSPDEILYNNYSFQTNSSLLQFLFAEGAKLPVLKIDNPNTVLLSIDENSPINGELYNTISSNKNFQTVIDCLNTHENFHKAKLINVKRNANQASKTISINLTDIVLSNKELQLLDQVRFIEKTTSINSMVTGSYALLKKAFHLTAESVSTELIIGRDFFSK